MAFYDFLSAEELEDYHQQWHNLKGKFTPETPFAVHSGFPVIGSVFQYKDKPVFRAKILKKTLRKLDPYYLGKKGYIHANFHLAHYFIPIEQICHVSMPRLLPNYNDFIITDKFNSKKSPEMNARIHFDKNHPSIELGINFKKNKKRFLIRCKATFYEDNDNSILQEWYLDGVGEFRAYASCIDRLKNNFNPETASELIKKINAQEIRHRRISNPRKQLPEKEALIAKLNAGILPEQELHDYFSFWEPEPIQDYTGEPQYI